jgi:phosphoribosylformylglycinamidine cyclo-ligase
MRLPQGLRDPALVSCTDGVGTKLLVAIAMGKHDTIGIDAVAMNVNDLLCTGAQPLFVLDYIACGKLDPTIIEQIVAGVVQGCRQSGAALLGGETAELPDLYAVDHYDLAAFAVGVVETDRRLGPHRVQASDVVVALPSSGLHSNGYSLARKALLHADHAGLGLHDPLPGAPEMTVGEALLVPTRIYASAFAAVQALPGSPLHAAAHITGGGLIENPPRAVPSELAIELDLSPVVPAPILRAVAECGIARDEMLRTFNCGVGMLLFVDHQRLDDVLEALRAAGETPQRVGVLRPRGDGPAVLIHG